MIKIGKKRDGKDDLERDIFYCLSKRKFVKKLFIYIGEWNSQRYIPSILKNFNVKELYIIGDNLLQSCRDLPISTKRLVIRGKDLTPDCLHNMHSLVNLVRAEFNIDNIGFRDITNPSWEPWRGQHNRISFIGIPNLPRLRKIVFRSSIDITFGKMVSNAKTIIENDPVLKHVKHRIKNISIVANHWLRISIKLSPFAIKKEDIKSYPVSIRNHITFIFWCMQQYKPIPSFVFTNHILDFYFAQN